MHGFPGSVIRPHRPGFVGDFGAFVGSGCAGVWRPTMLPSRGQSLGDGRCPVVNP